MHFHKAEKNCIPEDEIYKGDVFALSHISFLALLNCEREKFILERIPWARGSINLYFN